MAKVTFGVIFSFIGLLMLFDAMSTRTLEGRIGGYFLSLIFLIIGIVLFVKGVKGKNREKELIEKVDSLSAELKELKKDKKHKGDGV
jgi:uncharacterized membrane protein